MFFYKQAYGVMSLATAQFQVILHVHVVLSVDFMYCFKSGLYIHVIVVSWFYSVCDKYRVRAVCT